MTPSRMLLAGFAFIAAWFLAGAASGTAGDRQPFLPPAPYKELVGREVRILQDSLKGTPGDDHLARARLAAVMIAHLASDAEAKQTGAIQERAMEIAKLLENKTKVPDARKLAASLTQAKGGQSKPFEYKFGDVLDTMNHLRPKAKGGDGIHSDLQTSGPLKSLNGIEEKIRSLAKKKLSETALNKSASEMVLLGFRLATLAEVISDSAPAQKAKEWRDISGEMHTASRALALASEKRDAAAILQAGTRLNTSCERCHQAFR